MLENCGISGIYSNENCAENLWYSIFKLQHRGQRYCGIATFDKEIKMMTHKGFVRHTFTPEELNELQGNYGIGHVSLRDRQPIILESKIGEFAIAFTGNIINSQLLFEKLESKGHTFFTKTHIELISKLITQGKNFVDGIEKMDAQIEGSYTLVILTSEGIYAVRGPYGFKPLILCQNKDTYGVASESRAFTMLGMEIVRDVEPGEIILIDKKGFHTKKKLASKRKAYCAFEWAYIASRDSIIDGISVATARNNLGAMLAKRNDVCADLVSAVPFSGIGYALGYHQESKISYDEVFLYDRFASRSYTPLEQKERDEEAKIKLSVLKETVKDKNIILCDDSIVRGTQIMKKVKDLKSAGAKEVHLRIGCPPLLAPCRFDISTRSYEELIAKKYSVEEIAKLVGADSLMYNTIEDFVKAIGLPENELCLECFGKAIPL